MSNELIFVLVFFWLVSAVYVMLYHNKRWTLGLDTIIGAIILGPILALLIGDDEEKILKQKRKKENKSNENHRRWFQLSDMVNRERMRSNWFRTIPPPPPISRIERAQSERETAIRSAIERIDKNKLKDFKFFRG